MAYVQFSSFQIGKMLNVSRQAVNQWIDKGYIKSYRTPGGHRRVKREDLISFLETREIPIPDVLLEGPGKGQPSARIMLVDEDQDFVTLLQHSIRERMPTAQFVVFHNGYDALVAIGANPPDVLVLDVKLPNINGIEVCRRLKENPLTASLPIAVVSNQDAKELGASLKSLRIERVHGKSEPAQEIAEDLVKFTRERIAMRPATG